MNDEKTMRLWMDIGGIHEKFLDELEETTEMVATKMIARRRKVKYGALVATAATISATIAIVMLKPKLATTVARTISSKFKFMQRVA